MNIDNLVKPTSLTEAYKLLTADQSNTVIAGGAWLKMSKRTIKNGIDLTAINSLKGIKEEADVIRIGSMTTLSEIERDETLKQYYSGILPQAIAQIMGVGLRNLVTIGGNIMSKHGFSDIATPLLALPCTLEFHHQGILSFAEFIEQKPIKKDILKAIILEKQEGRGYFKKVKKTALDFAILNLALTKDDDGFALAIGSRPSIAMNAKEAETYLSQQPILNDTVIKKAATMALKHVKLGDNPRASKAYRSALLETYMLRGLHHLNQTNPQEGASK